MAQTLNYRLKLVVALNILISLYYFRFFWRSLSWERDFQTPLYGLSSFGLLLGAFFLLRQKKIGKRLTRWVAILGIIAILGIAIWGLTYFGDSRYPFESSMRYLIANTLIYLIRHAYPIIAGFLILNKPDEELGLS